jgi:hypothetical protein
VINLDCSSRPAPSAKGASRGTRRDAATYPAHKSYRQDTHRERSYAIRVRDGLERPAGRTENAPRRHPVRRQTFGVICSVLAIGV